MSRREFDDYFDGRKEGVAIWIVDVVEFAKLVPLDDLREAWNGFREAD